MATEPFVLTPVPDPRPRADVGPPFQRLNGRWLALDLVNTVRAWREGGTEREGRDWGDRVEGERLGSFADLLAWSRLEGIVEADAAERLERAARERPRDAEATLERARALRAALYRVFRAGVEGRSPLAEDVERLDAERRTLARGEALVRAGGGFRLEWRSDAPALEALLWPPLRSAVALLTSPEELSRVGQCDGRECGWLFYDTPRGRPRRWCDIRDCGNVAKVRAYREREQDG